MVLGKINPALRWFTAICLASFVASGCLWYLLPHDFRPSKRVELEPASVPLASPLPQARPAVVTPAPGPRPPDPQEAITLHPADPRPMPPQPAPTLNPSPLPQPLPAVAARPLEKARACVAGDPELRELFADKLRQSVSGKIVSGDCSAIDGPTVIVSGFASTLGTSDPACKTIDEHLYEVIFSISRPGTKTDISRTVSAARCASRVGKEDAALGRDAKNQAVLQGVISLRDLLPQD